MSNESPALIPLERIEHAILFLRGQKVILDADLAKLYGVSTKRLNEQVRRNPERFPSDFLFQLTTNEWEALRSQTATLKRGRGQHRKYLPYVFTEHGAVMAANVLSSPVAIAASIQVVRAFVRLRLLLASHEELSRKLEALEKKYAEHDEQLATVFEAIRQLMKPPSVEPKKGRIGFRATPAED
jgi:hypothetical protein